MRRTLSGLFLIVLLVGVLVACGPQQPLTAEETANQFLQAIVNRDHETAYKLLSPDSQSTISVDAFAGMMNDAWEAAKISELKIKSTQDEAVLSKTGTRASIAYAVTMTTQDGVTTDIYNALSLVLYNGQWGVIWPPVR